MTPSGRLPPDAAEPQISRYRPSAVMPGAISAGRHQVSASPIPPLTSSHSRPEAVGRATQSISRRRGVVSVPNQVTRL
jgi:hypothetical protein